MNSLKILFCLSDKDLRLQLLLHVSKSFSKVFIFRGMFPASFSSLFGVCLAKSCLRQLVGEHRSGQLRWKCDSQCCCKREPYQSSLSLLYFAHTATLLPASQVFYTITLNRKPQNSPVKLKWFVSLSDAAHTSIFRLFFSIFLLIEWREVVVRKTEQLLPL